VVEIELLLSWENAPDLFWWCLVHVSSNFYARDDFLFFYLIRDVIC
jgi:hypothetical protein